MDNEKRRHYRPNNVAIQEAETIATVGFISSMGFDKFEDFSSL